MEQNQEKRVDGEDLKELICIMLDCMADGPAGDFKACRLRAEDLLGFKYKPRQQEKGLQGGLLWYEENMEYYKSVAYHKQLERV